VRGVAVPAPVAEPVRIAVLGDFHLVDEASLRHARDCLQAAMAQQPDIILLVGDYVHTHHGLPYLKRALQGIRAPLGVYAVLGNHDHWSGKDAVIRALQESGVIVLGEANRTVRKGDTRLTLVGIHDLLCHKPHWEQAFRGVPAKPDHPVILLSHNPDAVLSPYRDRTTLIVSGHTHAGQVWAPTTAHRAMQPALRAQLHPQNTLRNRPPLRTVSGGRHLHLHHQWRHARARCAPLVHPPRSEHHRVDACAENCPRPEVK
jgi:predicted MPP superfamily phosphohydrolase